MAALETSYYTKSFETELRDLENGLRWAPTHKFCETFNNRFQESQRRLSKLEHKGKLRDIIIGHLAISEYWKKNGTEETVKMISYSWALFNVLHCIEDVENLFDKVDIIKWGDVNRLLNGSNVKDINKVIEGLTELASDLGIVE